MKLINTLALGTALCLVPALVNAQSCCGGMKDGKKDAAMKCGQTAAQKIVTAQKTTVIVDGGYSPSTIVVTKGKPVELTFTRKSQSGCDGTIVIKSLKVSKDLKTGESTVVKFTPTKTGTIPFTCGMGMLQGKIVVK